MTDTRPVSYFRRVKEYHVEPSDRVALVAQANRFVELIVAKQWPNAIHGASAELTSEEQSTYVAALRLLRHNFEAGAKESELYDRRYEVEQRWSETTPGFPGKQEQERNP